MAINGESVAEKRSANKLMFTSTDENTVDFSHLFPKWKTHNDGSISCAPDEAGGCGSAKLVLRRILKINWAAKLVKNAEEIVTGCKVYDGQSSDCTPSTGLTSFLSSDIKKSIIIHCSCRNDTNDNILYYPTSEDLKHEGISHFRKHWGKGEPVIVKRVFDPSLASSWDPMSIWRGIQETADERVPENNTVVKVMDYLSQSEVCAECLLLILDFPPQLYFFVG